MTVYVKDDTFSDNRCYLSIYIQIHMLYIHTRNISIYLYYVLKGIHKKSYKICFCFIYEKYWAMSLPQPEETEKKAS